MNKRKAKQRAKKRAIRLQKASKEWTTEAVELVEKSRRRDAQRAQYAIANGIQPDRMRIAKSYRKPVKPTIIRDNLPYETTIDGITYVSRVSYSDGLLLDLPALDFVFSSKSKKWGKLQ